MRTIIYEKSDMEILNDENLIPKEFTINWDINFTKTTAGAIAVITIERVLFSGSKDSTGEPISFEIAPENCTVNATDKGLTDDIFPAVIIINSLNKKAVINF